MTEPLDKMQPLTEKMKPGFYGEFTYVENESDLEDAYKYLALWKKSILKKLKGLKQIGEDQIVYRPANPEIGMSMSTLGIKIEMRAE